MLVKVFKIVELLLLLNQVSQILSVLNIFEQWNEIYFNFPTDKARLKARISRRYIPGAAYIHDLAVHYTLEGGFRVFVSLPRTSRGVPISLGTINRNIREEGRATIDPYPKYSWHYKRNCNGIISATSIAIDQCYRLWVIDSGKRNDSQICSPQILAFNIFSNKLILKHRIENYTEDTFYSRLVVDVKHPDCEDTYLYIADPQGFTLLVFELKTRSTWTIYNKHFFPDPHGGVLSVGGEVIEVMSGIDGMALSKYIGAHEERTLYFHASSTLSESIANVLFLRNSTIWRQNGLNPETFVSLGQKPSQSFGQDIDGNGILYFGLANRHALACWNTAIPYTSRNIEIIAQDNKSLQYIDTVKVIPNLQGEEVLWVLSNRYHKYLRGTMNNNDINFRIMSSPLNDMISGTKCDLSYPPYKYYNKK